MNINETYELLLNLPGVRVSKVSIQSKRIDIHCEIKAKECPCPNCGKPSSAVVKYYERELRDMGILDREVYLQVRMRQFHCPCGRYFSEVLEFAESNKGHTRRQTDFMFILANKLSYSETGAILNVHSKTVSRLVLAECENVINVEGRYRQVRRLGIDELSHRKGKKDFVCVLTDLERGVVIDILEDRKKDTLIAHFQKIGANFCNQVEYVSCDFWDAYITASEKCFPNAKIVIDHFHVVKLLNESLDTFRKELRKKDKENPSYRRLKWILYKQYHTLSDEQIDDLQAAFRDSLELEKCYWKREEFHQILDREALVRGANPEKKAVEGITSWVASLAKEGISQFDGFVKTLTKRKEYIANYVIDFVTNAATEGLNNLIRSLKRTAWGMPNFNNLRLRVLAMST